MEKNENKLEINDKFLKNYLPQKLYHNHSDLDLWINISIIQLLNYNKLLKEELIQTKNIKNVFLFFFNIIISGKR